MENKILLYLNEIEKLKNGEYVNPITVEIDPSNICNADCPWCMFSQYRQASKANLKWETYVKLVYELRSLGVKSITFTGGGEPLMNPKFNDMISLAKDLGFEIGLVTNGILLNKVKNPDYFKFIRVSLDSSNREMYQKVKGIDAFDTVIDNISSTIKKNPSIGLSYVVGPDNNYNFNEAEQLAKSLGVLYLQIKPAYLNEGIFSDFKPIKDDLVINTKRHKKTDRLICLIAHLVGVVTADSGVYYCCQGRGKINYYLGSVAQESFETIWRRRLKHKNIAIKQCPPCRYYTYYKRYKELMSDSDIFFEHRNFL